MAKKELSMPGPNNSIIMIIMNIVKDFHQEELVMTFHKKDKIASRGF